MRPSKLMFSMNDQDLTPPASVEPWKVMPSFVDQNFFNLNRLENAPMDCCTSTLDGNNESVCRQAYDLQPSNMEREQDLWTPLSMSTPGESIPTGPSGVGLAGSADFHAMPPHQSHRFNPFIHSPQFQPPFTPSKSVHEDTGHEMMQQNGSPHNSDLSNDMMQRISPTRSCGFRQPIGTQFNSSIATSAEKFRYHSTLNSSTAMIKHSDEIPITYLNKGQAYSLTIVDSCSTLPLEPGATFRTFVRVSFDDEQQRQQPLACWNLWKERRGTSEAHQRGGEVQALEFVEVEKLVKEDDKQTRVELESSSFDGFSVVWTPGHQGALGVSLGVRFNFLSTDFSLSKGVKGIALRLCSKTNLVRADLSEQPNVPSAEICFCKVKLFRDHGAERKLSNDVEHVKHSMGKLRQQLVQVESGVGIGKRMKSSGTNRASDLQKQKQTWSMTPISPAGDDEGSRMTVATDLRFKLQTLEDMFSSTRPVSVLYLRGGGMDDPEMYPVLMPDGISSHSLYEMARVDPKWRTRSQHGSCITGSMMPPSPSLLPVASQASGIGQAVQSQNYDAPSSSDVSAHNDSGWVTKGAETDRDGSPSVGTEPLGVESLVKLPLQRPQKPVACFYIQRQQHIDMAAKRSYYQAIYLMERTVRELNSLIAAKWGLEASKILRTIHISQNNLEVEVDDDVLCQLKEGQDMKLDVQEVTDSPIAVHSNDKETMDITSLQASPPKTEIILRLTF